MSDASRCRTRTVPLSATCASLCDEKPSHGVSSRARGAVTSNATSGPAVSVGSASVPERRARTLPLVPSKPNGVRRSRRIRSTVPARNVPSNALPRKAAAQLARDRPAARLGDFSRIELHRHRLAARVVAVGEPRTFDRDPPREVAGEVAGAIAGGLQRDFEAAHAPGHVRCVEHQLRETAERRVARDEAGAQARRRGRAVGGDLAFEPRAADRHRERRDELPGLDAEASAQVAYLARDARPVRDAQLDVGVEQRQPLQVEVGPLELAEGFGQGLDLLVPVAGCAQR